MARRSATIPPFRRRSATRPRGARIALGLVRVALGLILFSLVWVLAYRFINPPITGTMASDLLSGRGATRDWMTIERIDRDMVRAAIGAEDSKFCSHDGFDLEAIEDAMKRNASGGRIRGGSTISQQTAKNAFLWQGGGYVRKGAEAWFTLLIEKIWGKRRIMEVYLNLAETGIGTYGVSAGAVRYFGHDASAMSRTEAARIAAVLPLPKRRGAVAPKGFTKRYGATIATRIGQAGRDGLDACVYRGITPPKDVAPPVSTEKRPIPGDEYENPPSPAAEAPVVDDAAVEQPVASEPAEQIEPEIDAPPPPEVGDSPPPEEPLQPE